MQDIVKPYLPERGGIRFRDKNLTSLQVTASKWHVVDGKKKIVRTFATIKLSPFTDNKTFNVLFEPACPTT